jgi:ribosomal protein S18 acetylase RimI-like enzyme
METRGNASLEIRLANVSETNIIADLIYDSFVEYKPLYTEKGFIATTTNREEIKRRIGGEMIWVAMCDDVIAGTISILPVNEGIFIKSVAVAPVARRRGLGKALMRHAEKIAEQRHVKYLELNTTEFLHEAIGLYEGFGFIKCGYEDLCGTRLIKMKKVLDKNRSQKNLN